MANPMKVIKGIKKATKTPGVKGRGTKSTTIKEPKSNVKVKPQDAASRDARAARYKRQFN